jgi:hypothetical protein
MWAILRSVSTLKPISSVKLGSEEASVIFIRTRFEPQKWRRAEPRLPRCCCEQYSTTKDTWQ